MRKRDLFDALASVFACMIVYRIGYNEGRIYGRAEGLRVVSSLLREVIDEHTGEGSA